MTEDNAFRFLVCRSGFLDRFGLLCDQLRFFRVMMTL